MSPDADRAKVAATRRLGAEVLMSAPRSDARRAMAEELAAARQAALVPPYDDLDVIAGQATIAAEIFQRTSGHGPTCIYVPIGGGGLLAGIAAAVRQMHPSTRVIGVEPEFEADAFRSFHSGTLQRLEGPSDSIADAIKVQELGSLTWPIIREHVDDVVTVFEAEIAQACGLAADLANLVVEPGGAVGIAAALGHDDGAEPGAAVAIACGGNIELERLAALAAGERVAHG